MSRILKSLSVSLLVLSSAAWAQAPQSPEALKSAEKSALQSFASLDGTWRGSGWMLMPDHTKVTFVQTERVGPMLDGALKVIEGKGYGPDGKVAFNAFAIISFDPQKKAYDFRTYAEGHAGDFVIEPTKDGFVWKIPAGPMTIQYAATVKGGTWHEVGERVMPGQKPVKFFEMTLKHVGKTDWPAAGALGPK